MYGTMTIAHRLKRKTMLDDLIDEYVTILDRDPLDHSESTDVILLEFANKVIQATINDLGQSNYYKPATVTLK
jgi:hypothetical protein